MDTKKIDEILKQADVSMVAGSGGSAHDHLITKFITEASKELNKIPVEKLLEPHPDGKFGISQSEIALRIRTHPDGNPRYTEQTVNSWFNKRNKDPNFVRLNWKLSDKRQLSWVYIDLSALDDVHAYFVKEAIIRQPNRVRSKLKDIDFETINRLKAEKTKGK